jgi:hypothetical protein
MSEYDILFSSPTVATSPVTITTRTGPQLTPVVGVDFRLLPRAPRSLLLSTGTNRFQVLLDYSTPPLRSFLRESRQAHHDIIQLRVNNANMSHEIMRLRASHPDPDNDLYVPQRPATPPSITLPIPDPIIRDDHPQLVELRNERDAALSDLASITNELTVSATRIETLNQRVQQLEESALNPSASVSQVASQIVTSPSVTDAQLRTLARATRLATASSVASGHSRIHPNHSPNGELLYATFVRLAMLRNGATNHNMHPHDLMHYSPLIQNFTPDLDSVPRTRNVSAEDTILSLLLTHTSQEIDDIAAQAEHTCSSSTPCLFSYMQLQYDAISTLPLTAVIAMFYNHVANDVFNIRRYPATALRLISFVSDPTVIGTLADIATRRQRNRTVI